MGSWRIGFLVFSAALAAVYLGPSVVPFNQYADACASCLCLLCSAAFAVMSIITLICYIFVSPLPSFFRRDITPTCFRRNQDGSPKVVRTVSVSKECFANMENCYSRGITFWMIVIYPVLISVIIQVLAGGYYDHVNWRDPDDYGFYLYPVLFASLAIPWHLLDTWRSGRRCPYCLTPRTKDNFDSEHHVCLRCHTQFLAENATEPPPAPADKA